MITAKQARELALKNAKESLQGELDKVEAAIKDCIANGFFEIGVVINSNVAKFVIAELRKQGYQVELKSVGPKSTIQISFHEI